MDFMRISYGFPMDSLWMSYGFRSPLDFLRISFIWISYGFPHGFPMGFLWLSYGFQMDYEEGGPSEGGGPSVLGIEGGGSVLLLLFLSPRFGALITGFKLARGSLGGPGGGGCLCGAEPLRCGAPAVKFPCGVVPLRCGAPAVWCPLNIRI